MSDSGGKNWEQNLGQPNTRKRGDKGKLQQLRQEAKQREQWQKDSNAIDTQSMAHGKMGAITGNASESLRRILGQQPTEVSNIAESSAGKALDQTDHGRDKISKNFDDLRWDTHEKIKAELQMREMRSPNPTDEEYAIGALIEEIEPQARPLVQAMYRKGYTTISSGFYRLDSRQQELEGHFILDEDTKDNLKAKGVEIRESGEYTLMLFRPKNPDLREIEEEGLRIVALIPDKGKTALPNQNLAAREFRTKYTSETNLSSEEDAPNEPPREEGSPEPFDMEL